MPELFSRCGRPAPSLDRRDDVPRAGTLRDGLGGRGAALLRHQPSGRSGARLADLGHVVERRGGEHEAHPTLTAHGQPAVDDVAHPSR